MLHDSIGKRLKSGLASNLGPRPAFLLVGEIDVFQSGCIPTLLDSGSQFRSEFSLSLYSGENELLAVLQLVDIVEFCSHLSDLDIRHSTSRFLAITADEGHCGAFLQQVDNLSHIFFLEASSFGNQVVVHTHSF